MATVQSMTLDRLLALEDATVVGGHIDGSGDLILEQFGGGEINAGSAIPAVPDATETVKGKVELATTAEATAGSSTTHAVTPAGLAAAVGTLVPDATDTVKGKVELATNAETIAGADATRAVTPAGLRAVFSAMWPVGATYIATVSTNPASLLGFGTWVSLGAGRVLVSQNGSFPAGNTGGSATSTLVEANLPAHAHSVNINTNTTGAHTHGHGQDHDGFTGSAEWINHSTGISGAERIYYSSMTTEGDHAHNVSGNTGNGAGSASAFSTMPPWLSVYMWQRTA